MRVRAARKSAGRNFYERYVHFAALDQVVNVADVYHYRAVESANARCWLSGLIPCAVEWACERNAR